MFLPMLLTTAVNAQAGETWTPRTDAELATALSETCEQAKTAEQLVLLEFSAPWCGDCRKLKELKTETVVVEEMKHFAPITVDVGRFDRHEDLLKAFGVSAIAHWAVLAPADCAAPVTSWTQRASGTLEPAHGTSGPRTGPDVAAWLKAARTKTTP